MARILLCTFGSLGDLNPMLGLARELQQRGHEPVLATSPYYATLAGRLGIAFHPIPPDVDPNDAALIARVVDPARGPEVVIRELVLPHLRGMFDSLRPVAEASDFLVSHPLAFAVPPLAELLRKRWAGVALAPISLFSASDLPAFPPFPRLVHLRAIPGFGRAMMSLARLITRKWGGPVRELRRSLGLLPGGDPIYEGQFSPYVNLALFPSVLARPQRDWPPNTVVTGAIEYDQADLSPMPPALADFLDAGEPPILFTLGSAAVNTPGRFFDESLAAAKCLGRRAVLLVGSNSPLLTQALPEGILAVPSAPFSQLFARAGAIVLSGGIGTLSRALAAGKPMLIIPFSHDQPDNAFRATRLGVARILRPWHYTAARAAREIRRLLDDPGYAASARKIAAIVAGERPARAAAEAIEAHLA